VGEGRRRAAAAGLAVEFREVNAFAMHNVGEGEFDLVFLAQTMHHFTPGQLARMVEQATRRAERFVGIDVRRSLHVWGIVPGMAALSPHWGFLHDGIVSIRKMYSEPELALIARLGAPGHAVRTRGVWPGYSVLEVMPA
jgi:SAM-dependent methyltransferase